MTRTYIFEPAKAEIVLTELIGSTLLHRYCSKLVDSLKLEKKDKVLDYCSGSGNISKHMAEELQGGQLVYADVSGKWLSHAGKKLEAYKHVQGWKLDDFCGLIGGGNFDKILVHFALHDFPTDYQAAIISQLALNLKQGGVLLIREPLSVKHGMPLHILVNLFEAIKCFSYDYEVKESRLTGKYVDLRAVKK